MSHPNTFKRSLAMSAVALMLSAGMLSGKTICPQPGPVTEESYTHDFPAEAMQTLEQIEDDAYKVRRAAEDLQVYARNPLMYSHVTHAANLSIARENVNAIAAKMCRLSEIRRVSEPWQRRNIDQVMTALRMTVNDANRAIATLSDSVNMSGLYQPSYREALDSLRNGAEALRHASTPDFLVMVEMTD